MKRSFIKHRLLLLVALLLALTLGTDAQHIAQSGEECGNWQWYVVLVPNGLDLRRDTDEVMREFDWGTIVGVYRTEREALGATCARMTNLRRPGETDFWAQGGWRADFNGETYVNVSGFISDGRCREPSPDTDDDGVPDDSDSCADTPQGTPVDYWNGCPCEAVNAEMDLVAHIGIAPDPPVADESVVFTVNVEGQRAGETLTYEWFLDNMYMCDTPTCAWPGAVVGEHTVEVTVYGDSRHAMDARSFNVPVAGEMVARIGMAPDPPVAEESVVFTVNVEGQRAGEILTYEWFLDNVYMCDTPTCAWPGAVVGEHTVEVIVYGDGRHAMDARRFNVPELEAEEAVTAADDRDGDGIPNDKDACPDKYAETKDGCPKEAVPSTGPATEGERPTSPPAYSDLLRELEEFLAGMGAKGPTPGQAAAAAAAASTLLGVWVLLNLVRGVSEEDLRRAVQEWRRRGGAVGRAPQTEETATQQPEEGEEEKTTQKPKWMTEAESRRQRLAKQDREFRQEMESFRQKMAEEDKKFRRGMAEDSARYWAKRSQANIDHARANEMLESVAGWTLWGADLAVDVLEALTGPVGRVVKKVYTVAKGTAGGLGEALAKGDDYGKEILRGTGKGLVDLGISTIKGKALNKLDVKYPLSKNPLVKPYSPGVDWGKARVSFVTKALSGKGVDKTVSGMVRDRFTTALKSGIQSKVQGVIENRVKKPFHKVLDSY